MLKPDDIMVTWEDINRTDRRCTAKAEVSAFQTTDRDTISRYLSGEVQKECEKRTRHEVWHTLYGDLEQELNELRWKCGTLASADFASIQVLLTSVNKLIAKVKFNG